MQMAIAQDGRDGEVRVPRGDWCDRRGDASSSRSSPPSTAAWRCAMTQGRRGTASTDWSEVSVTTALWRLRAPTNLVSDPRPGIDGLHWWWSMDD